MRANRLIAKNIYYNIGTKFLTLILGMLLPRLFITSYGSEVNGLLSTVTQIFTYLALVEAGIGNSATNALYKPLVEKDYNTANRVVVEARKYYRKVSVFYGLGIIAFSVLFPFLAKTTVDRTVVFLVIILQGGANFISYYFTAVYTQLLIADGKRFVNENIGFAAYIMSSISKIVLIYCGFNVVAVQLVYLVVQVLKAPVLIIYCKNCYQWLNAETKPTSTSYLKERGAFVVHEASNTIFNNTDVFVISTFCSFSMASVYTVYNLVFSSITMLLAVISSSLSFVLGQGQYRDDGKLCKKYDLFSTIYGIVSFTLFSSCYILISPFISLYTKGVADINYIIVGLPLLFAFSNLLSSIRATGSILINVSGNAKATQSRTIIEASINLITSLIFVNTWGIHGVLLGTIIALLYRSNDIIIYANKMILKRSPLIEYKNVLANTILFGAVVTVTRYYKIHILGYLSFIGYGIIITLLLGIIFTAVSVVLNRQLYKELWKTVFNKKEKCDEY